MPTPLLLRFLIVHFATGLATGVGVAAVMFFNGTGILSGIASSNDRLIGFLMLATMLGGYLGVASVATALHFAAEEG